MHKRVRRGRDDDVVGANQRPTAPVPVVETIGSGHTHESIARGEPRFHALEPLQRDPAVGVDVGKDVARRGAPRGLACDDEAFPRLVDYDDTVDRARHGAGSVRACVVDDEDFVWRSGLGEKRKETGRQQAGFVIGANDHGDR